MTYTCITCDAPVRAYEDFCSSECWSSWHDDAGQPLFPGAAIGGGSAPETDPVKHPWLRLLNVFIGPFNRKDRAHRRIKADKRSERRAAIQKQQTARQLARQYRREGTLK